jgi:hypothetical protein
MITLKHLTDAVLRRLIGTRAFTTGDLAIGSNKAKVQNATAIAYCINGVQYTKAATDDLFVFTDTTVQAASSTKYYMLGLNSSGTASVTTGTSSALPAVPSGVCPVGYVKIVTSAAGTFIPGTTLLDAAQVTATYVNLSCYPLTLS